MGFVLVFVAWLFFCVGTVNLSIEIYVFLWRIKYQIRSSSRLFRWLL